MAIMMRVSVRDQVCLFVVLAVGCAVAVLSIVTWFYDRNLVVDLRTSRLEVIATLKSKQLTQLLLVYSAAAKALSARAGIINPLVADQKTHHVNQTAWADASNTFGIILTSYDEVVMISVQDTDLSGRLNISTTQGFEDLSSPNNSITIKDTSGDIAAYNMLDGPPSSISPLIPNSAGVNASQIGQDGVWLGPVKIEDPSNATAVIYMASLTFPVFNNTTVATSLRNILGYMTVVFNLTSLLDVVDDVQGVGDTGQVIVLSPDNTLNTWPINGTGNFNVTRKDKFKYMLPPLNDPGLALQTEEAGSYPQARAGWRNATNGKISQGSLLDTHNSQGDHVSVGFATVAFAPTNWSMMLIVEQSYSEAFAPIVTLRNILLGSAFGAIGIIWLFTWPLAHLAVRPIRRLRSATKLAGRPPEYTESRRHNGWNKIIGLIRRRKVDSNVEAGSVYDSDDTTSSERRQNFHIPQKVVDKKRYIHDELTDLTATFNIMTDELLERYTDLEGKVKQRTLELQEQTLLAQSANEAKSMFVANITHELRTPLNGILGMCQVVMGEEDLPSRCRKNLEVVFKSGELLTCLLSDLLTFSKNQVGTDSQVKLEERPFRVREFITQVMALFRTQAEEHGIDLSYEIIPSKRHDWELSGDMNRILQVVINLMSNALKFTPQGGSVQLRISMDSEPVAYESAPGTREDDDINEKGPNVNATAISQPSSGSVQRPAPVKRTSSSGVINPNSELNKELILRTKDLGTTPPMSRSASPFIEKPDTARHFVEFSVIDTGPGVPAHMMQKIFEPFVQADVGLSRKYGGTGLGLSICSQLAKLMGGQMLLKSFEGTGSTFTLRIPLKLIASTAMSPSRHASMQSRRTFPLDGGDNRSTNSVISAAFTAVSVKEVVSQENVRLVGLSQPFFAPNPPVDPDPPYTPPGDGTPVATPDAAVVVNTDAEKISPISPIARSNVVGKDGKESPLANAISDAQEKRASLIRDQQEPIANAAASAKEAKTSAKGKTLSPIRVLVAEDNKVNQKVVVKMLEVEGVKNVTIAEDGQQAVERVKEALEGGEIFDLVLMDVQMPNVDGLESTRMIRKLGYASPIVALTAFAEEGNIKDCFNSGMDYFLAKPLKRPQIKHVLRTYCSTIAEEPAAEKKSGGGASANKTASKGIKPTTGSGEIEEEKKQTPLPPPPPPPPIKEG